MSRQDRLKISLVINILIFIFEIIGGYLYFVRSGWSFIQFYTEDSNTLTMFACLILAVYEYQLLHQKRDQIPGWVIWLKYLSTIGLTLTFLVVIFVLIPIQGIGEKAIHFMLLDGSMLYHHLICPILTFISFLWLDPLGKLTRKDTALSLVPTIIYAGIMLVLNILRIEDGPYPFLRVYEQPFFMSCIWFAAILGGAYLIAFVLRIMLNWQTKD